MKISIKLNEAQINELHSKAGQKNIESYLSSRLGATVTVESKTPNWLSGIDDFERELDKI